MAKRILIVDDEAYAADTTAALLGAADHIGEIEVSVCYLACDALLYARRSRIDILVTDIKMPGTDGIVLAEKVRAIWPLCQIILLTAYKQFDYAYRAIQMEGIAYVLKLDGAGALVSQIEKTIRAMDHAALRRQYIEQAQERAKASLPLLRREWMLDMIHGAQYNQAEIDQVAEELSISVNLNQPFSIVLVLLHRYEAKDTMYERLQIIETLKQVARANLPRHMRAMWIQINANRLIWLIEPTQASERMSSYWLEGILENIQQTSEQSFSLPISMNYLTFCEDWRGLRSAFQLLDAYQAQYAIAGQQMWIAGADAAPGCKAPSYPAHDSGRDTAAQWRYAYESGDPKAESYLAGTLDALRRCESMHSLTFLRLFQNISVQFDSILDRQHLPEELSLSLGVHRLFDAAAFSTPEEAAHFFETLSREISLMRRQTALNAHEAVLQRVDAYISDHLREDISLSTLGEIAHLDASYLSRIYKRMRGETLIKHIADAKVSHACRLLRDTTQKIHEIAAQVGFSNSAYFSYFFRKNTGLTPKEYRDKHIT